METPGGTEAPTVCYRHPRREAGVRCVRCERYICPECMRPAAVGFHCPECVAEGRTGVRQARTVYGGRVRSGAIVTGVLVGANVVVYLVTAVTGSNLGVGLISGTNNSSMYRRFELVPFIAAQGNGLYRLLTAMFLHYGLLHIAFNMWALVYIGPPLEAALGRLRFLLLYLLAGLGGSIATYAFGPPYQASAGASGAIFGLFGAFFVIARHQRRDTRMILVLIAVNLAFSFSVPGIDVRAHIGGLVTGALLAAALAYAPAGSRRPLFQGVGIALVALLLAGAAATRTHELRSSPPPLPAAQAGRIASIAASAPAGLPPRR